MSSFELPIYYLENKEDIEKNIVEDLELLESNGENESRESLLEKIYNPASKIGKLNLNKQCEYFTSDKTYLKQTQDVIKKWTYDDNMNKHVEVFDKFHELWDNIKNDEGFIDKYYYVDVEYFKFLNNSSLFLQILSIYNLVSPVLTLLIPVILLIVPFFMLKFNGIDINLTSYYKVLKEIFSKHALGNFANVVGEVSWEKRIYALISIAFYLFSIYQNTLVCYRFYKNFSVIHDNLFLLNEYLSTTINNYNKLEANIEQHSTYSPFLNVLRINKSKCANLKSDLERIKPFTIKNLTNKSNEIGYIMKCFYEVHTNHDIHDIIEYSFGFNAYMEHMNQLNNLYREKLINKCSFGKKLKFTKSFYPYLLNSSPVKNDISIDKNIIITGPNASGKTTLLKTTLFNIIFSQSVGFGFYTKATIPLYNKIHCYLNIPDTSGRDSLFQAEARRCKEIIDSLEDKQKHFCIFDELFSGTNPNEACASSYGFIKYLNQSSNIDFILTTHLIDICHDLDSEINNNNMNVKQIDELNFEYTYTIKKGISSIKGGLKVLSDLIYPEAILSNSINYLNNLK